MLYCKFKQSTNILIDILFSNYLIFYFIVNSNYKVLINPRIIHFTVSQFVNATLNEVIGYL